MVGLSAADNLEGTEWVIKALSSSNTVRGIVPKGYECYARVLHPAWQYALEDCQMVKKPVTWAEVAARRGCVTHRLVQWPQVSGMPLVEDHVIWRLARAGCVILSAPDEGSIPLMVAGELKKILRSHAQEPISCWFGVWTGYGELHNLGLGKPGVIGNSRYDWFLFRGAEQNIEYSFSETDLHQSANLVWAEDRSWCLGVGIDLHSTYIGGSESLISSVLASGDLEAHTAFPDDDITIHADQVNPPEPHHGDLVTIRTSVLPHYLKRRNLKF